MLVAVVRAAAKAAAARTAVKLEAVVTAAATAVAVEASTVAVERASCAETMMSTRPSGAADLLPNLVQHLQCRL